MKWLVPFLMIACMVPVSVQAKGRYGSAGCGLGSMIIESDGFVQIFAGTTNSLFGTQTFGITSGTSNCSSGGVVKQDSERVAFTEAALPEIMEDAASGQGQYLYALGLLYGCNTQGLDLFGQSLKSQLSTICAGDSCNDAAGFLTALEASFSSDQSLTQSCPMIVAM